MNNNISKEFDNKNYDELKELCNYYKSEYMLLSLSYNSLKNDNKSLKTRNKILQDRFNNLQKLVDHSLNKSSLYVADYDIVED